MSARSLAAGGEDGDDGADGDDVEDADASADVDADPWVDVDGARRTARRMRAWAGTRSAGSP